MLKSETKDFLMKVFLAICVVASLVFGCSKINQKFGMKDDNIIEESIEKIIENKTGIDVDLTPESSEGLGK